MISKLATRNCNPTSPLSESAIPPNRVLRTNVDQAVVEEVGDYENLILKFNQHFATAPNACSCKRQELTGPRDTSKLVAAFLSSHLGVRQ